MPLALLAFAITLKGINTPTKERQKKIQTQSYQSREKSYSDIKLRLQLHGAIYRPDSFVKMLRYCVNLKAIRYESTSLNIIVADKSHRVIVA